MRRRIGICLMVCLFHGALFRLVYAQDSLFKQHNVLVGVGISYGLFSGPLLNLSLGIESGPHAALLGIQRNVPLQIFKPGIIGGDAIIPWPLGMSLEYRRKFGGSLPRIRPFFSSKLMISRADLVEFIPEGRSRLGSWTTLRPLVGYGVKVKFFPNLHLVAEGAAGLDIKWYQAKGRSPSPAGWPAVLQGSLQLEWTIQHPH